VFSHQCDAKSATAGLQPHRASYVSVHSPKIDGDPDPDPTFHSDAVQASFNGADPDPHHFCLVF
jgi:hypothetical protein